MTRTRAQSTWFKLLASAALGAAFLSGVSCATNAAPGDWPRWRGPNFDDHSTDTGLLKDWPKEGPPLAWKATGIGSGYSSIAVADGKLFTTGSKDGKISVHCLDSGGKILWSTELGAAGGGNGYPGARGMPTVDGQFVYALAPEGDLACFAIADGKKVWSKSLVQDFGGKAPDWKYSESVLIDGDKLICTPGGTKGTLLALDKKTGNPLWQTAEWKDKAQYSSPVLATIDGVKQYVQLTMDSVAGISETGKLLWKAKRFGSTAVIPTPIVSGNFVFVTSGYKAGSDLFKITKDGDAFKSEVIYKGKDNQVMSNHHGGVILLDGKIYGYSDGGRKPDDPNEQPGWTCMDLMTGKLVWRENKKLGKGSISYADGHFYLRDEGDAHGSGGGGGPGTIVLIEATPDGWKEHGRFDPPNRAPQPAWAHIVIAGGKMYVRDQDVLLCYDVKAK
jgi:outer membrane protein assembly factor BamB